MPTVLEEAVAIQRRYYSETASKYEQMHAPEGNGDAFNKKLVEAMLQMLGAQSVLDVGTTTGYRLHDLRSALPNAFLCEVEPVDALLGFARRNDVLSSSALIRGTGLALPFADKSFDVVCEFTILHHVQRPDVVVKEMLRVARKAVVISDSNRFGQGGALERLLKLAMYKTGIWRAFDWLRTKGKGYRITDGDGVSYSYNAYDSFDLLASWADRLIILPTEGGKVRSWLHPLLNSPGVLACPIKEGS
ncbi:MAG TPA: class I SAM-dependent methyltransferase [Candidatus Sulfotelmatobacter sp.]|jgi:ubiquinone/menaquinone biosynthesis C-methylase UbiE|nr:class I SAM-dependent methyltransferase [Candidatus Sulfotelmatobacter sp.]